MAFQYFMRGNKMAKVGVGVIGLGRMGTVYASFIAGQLEDARLVAVSDMRPEALQSFTDRHSDVKGYMNYSDLLADQAVDAVVVVTPTSTHREVVIAAAEADK